MIATKQAKQAKQANEVKGNFTHEVLRNGKHVAIGTETYRSAAQREAALASGKAWQATAAAGSRVVEHFTENGKGRHVIRVGGTPQVQMEPWSEVDCDLQAQARHYSEFAPQHVQGVDYR